jgi:very-short-patch-repair endonuclease
MVPRIDHFNAQGVANTAWAFGTLNISDTRLFDALSHRAQEIISEFNPQCVANTAWAFGTLNISNTRLFDALSQRAQQIITQFKPQDVANTAWASATLKVSNTKLFDALSHRAQEIISQFKPQDVANTAWAFATLNISDTRLFDALSHRAQEIISEFNPQCVANTAWAFASLNLSNTKLFEALSHRAQQIITEFIPQHVSNTAWAFATLNISDTELFEALSHRAQKIISEFKSQEVAVTAWACAVNNPELVSKIASTKDLRMMHYSDLDWLQIYQALVGAGLERGPISAYPRYNTIISRYVPSAPSRFEHAVETTLRSVLSTTHFTLEFGKIFAGVVTDWTVELDGRKIVVECDGTTYHTTKGPDAGRRLGKDVLQDRICANLGYEVIHIDSTEWENAHDKIAFLREKLGI